MHKNMPVLGPEMCGDGGADAFAAACDEYTLHAPWITEPWPFTKSARGGIQKSAKLRKINDSDVLHMAFWEKAEEIRRKARV